MSNVAAVQMLARHRAFMTHSSEKRMGDIFSLSHSPRDVRVRKRKGDEEKLNMYTAVLNDLYPSLDFVFDGLVCISFKPPV